MDQQSIEDYCRDNGVPFKREGERVRVMDKTLLPKAMREACDERGFVITTAATSEVRK